jgi:ubiquinone/menaquinone biosynthesis C-methylase UbiE
VPSTPNICAGPFGAVYDFYIERPWLMQAIGRSLWGIDARPLYEAMSAIESAGAGETVIDVPCGGGVALRALSPGQQVDYLAGDIDEDMVERTRRRAAKRGLTQVQAGIADMEALPYGDGSADLFVSFSGLHMVADPAAAVREIARCTKPGGELVGTTFLREGGRRQRTLFARGAKAGHPLPPPREELIEMFRAAGVEDVEIEPRSGFASFRGSKKAADRSAVQS